jgi:hypothetical protein
VYLTYFKISKHKYIEIMKFLKGHLWKEKNLVLSMSSLNIYDAQRITNDILVITTWSPL